MLLRCYFRKSTDVRPALVGRSSNEMDIVVVSGGGLGIQDLLRVSRGGASVALTEDADILRRVRESCDFVMTAVRDQRPIYGITTALGGMSHLDVPAEESEQLQRSS